MRLLVDDACAQRIRAIMETYPIDGVTTNPTILARNGEAPYRALRELKTLLGPDRQLHVQVVSLDADGMVREAQRIRAELGKDTYIKIPVTAEGLKAIRRLTEAQYPVTATAIYTKMQAYLGAKAGALYAATYVNRIDNLGADGVATVLEIDRIFRTNGLNCRMLAASFKNSQQLISLCAQGIDSATVSPDVIEGLLNDQNGPAAAVAFKRDFETLCGAGKTMENCG
ncbi:MAG: transaldolase family protein [Oscillospiraceae bacterium]|nr:transaldolase family protein [Oscillospiraceae bacterium]